jgi:hypothetical protein
MTITKDGISISINNFDNAFLSATVLKKQADVVNDIFTEYDNNMNNMYENSYKGDSADTARSDYETIRPIFKECYDMICSLSDVITSNTEILQRASTEAGNTISNTIPS